MKAEIFPVLLAHLAISVVHVHCDIGEKIRLGLPVNPPDSSRVQESNIGLQTPLESVDSSTRNTAASTRDRKKFIVAIPHDTTEEFTLEKLCNDPFHSFLCKPTVPRKRRIDGNLRPGASLPQGFTRSNLNAGSAILSSNLEAANSDTNTAQIGYTYQKPQGQAISAEQSARKNVFTNSKLVGESSSNEYLPPVGSPKPLATNNVPFALPLEPSSLTVRPVTTTTPTTETQTVSTTQRISTTTMKRIFASSNTLNGFRNNQVFKTAVVTTTPGYVYKRPIVQPQFGFGNNFKMATASVNSPSASNQIVSAVSSGNEYLPPKDSLSPRPSDNVQFQVPFNENEDVKPASQNIAPSRTGSGVLSTGIDSTPKPTKKERTHTLEELCNESFHSFLCKPIVKPRRRIDGNIRPGANIPAHVLLSSGSNAQNVKQLPPNQSGGAVSDTGSLPVGYKYDKPSGQPFQTTNLSPQYAPRPNFAQPLYTYQQALLSSSPSNSQPSILPAANTPKTHSHPPNPSVPCTCQQNSNGPEPAAQNLASTSVPTGYIYTKPSTPFNLPSTTSRPTGYTYPKPSGQAFTLPPRPSSTEPPVQRGQQSINDSIENNALPPSSQFEILKL